jgi:hypothetical protein
MKHLKHVLFQKQNMVLFLYTTKRFINHQLNFQRNCGSINSKLGAIGTVVDIIVFSLLAAIHRHSQVKVRAIPAAGCGITHMTCLLTVRRVLTPLVGRTRCLYLHYIACYWYRLVHLYVVLCYVYNWLRSKLLLILHNI